MRQRGRLLHRRNNADQKLTICLDMAEKYNKIARPGHPPIDQ